MRELYQSVAASAAVFFASAGEHITGVLGINQVSASASKNGAAFYYPSMSASAELGRGWYRFTLSAAMVDTLGDLVYSISAFSADPVDIKFNVVYPPVAASAATWANLDVGVSSRLAATATGLGYLDVANSSRMAATATGFGGWGNIDVALSSRMAATATGFGNWDRLDVAMSSRLAGTATGLGNLTYLDVANSSRMAATATGFGNWGNLDVALSSRLAATATGVGFLTYLPTITASAVDIRDMAVGLWTIDYTGHTMSAYRSDGVTLLKGFTLSAASVASAVPAYIKRTPA